MSHLVLCILVTTGKPPFGSFPPLDDWESERRAARRYLLLFEANIIEPSYTRSHSSEGTRAGSCFKRHVEPGQAVVAFRVTHSLGKPKVRLFSCLIHSFLRTTSDSRPL